MSKLKEKILKINSYSIIIIIFVLGILSFSVTYFILKQNLNIEIKNIKEEYIQNQKDLMKYQINNFINYIEITRKSTFNHYKNQLKKESLTLSKILEKTYDIEIAKYLIQLNPFFKIGISDLEGNKLFATGKEYNKTKRLNLIKKLLNSHKKMMFINFNNKKYVYMSNIDNILILTIAFYQKDIDKIVKNLAKKYLYAIRFGPKNNGYISITEILNYKGGKNFAKVVALPVNPRWEGKLLSDDKKDAKGKEYRKEYLKIANTTGEGYVKYYFFKYSTNVIRPKISYVKLYKPYNWLIFSSVFLDDVNSIVNKKIEKFKKEVIQLLFIYLAIYILALLGAYLLSKKENQIIKKIIHKYEEEINKKNIALQKLNESLEEEVKRKTEELIKQMFTDKLTNLPNREKLIQDLDNNYVAIINIKDFTEINDFYGIEAGDKLLKEFANFLNQIYPTYKLASDEFAIINESPATLRKISSKILKILETHPFKIEDDLIKLRVNIGIGKTLTQADIALKYAKKSKKSIIVYNPNLPLVKEIQNNLKWKHIIEEAISNNNVLAYVQPIINNKTLKKEKFECLMRIRYQDKIYTPYFFLDIAKKANLYSKLQQIMIEKCFRKFSNLDYKFSINLSLTDLKNEKFIEFLFKKIDEYNVSNKLIIELLEDEELVRNEQLLKLIKRFKDKGIEIALDDFGSGYSNFIYLQDLDINIIKIDGSLIKNIENEKIYNIIKKIVEIAKMLKLQVVGEFVENEEILRKLKELGIDFSQGYYFSPPFDIEEI